MELHDGQDPQGPALPGARGVHEHGGGRAEPGLRARQRHAGGRRQRRRRARVARVHGAGAAPPGARARQGRHVPAVRARQLAAAVRLLRPHRAHPRPQVGQGAQGVPRAHVVRERGRVHARRARRAQRLVRRHREAVVAAHRRVPRDAQAARRRRAAGQLAAADAEEPGPLRGVQPHQHRGGDEHGGADRALVQQRAARGRGRRAGGGGAECPRPPAVRRRRGHPPLRLLHADRQARAHHQREYPYLAFIRFYERMSLINGIPQWYVPLSGQTLHNFY